MSNNSIIISTELEKSANPGSIIVTDSNNKQKYISPGSNGFILTSNGPGNEPSWQSSTLNNSFTITDGTTSQVVNSGDTLTITSGNGITATVSATDLLTILVKISTDANNDITIGTDGGIYYGLRIQRDSFLGLTSGNTVTLTQTPLEILFVSRNGQIKLPGIGNDYTISGTVITFSTSFGPSIGGAGSENIQVNYTY